ncbi:AAA family ATPase [Intestinibacter sp.]
MLRGFMCKNFSSYRNELEFTMEAANIKEFNDINTFDTKYGKMLKSTVVYGANAGGKSNFIKAIDTMRLMVGMSMLDRNIIKQIEYFKFNTESNKEPIVFEISFAMNDILYTYGFEVLDKLVNKEWLYKKSSRTVPILERKSPEWEEITLHGDLKDGEAIKRYTRKDSLFISTAATFNIELAEDIMQWFSDIKILGPDSGPSDTLDSIEENDKYKEDVLEYLQKADIGIEDVTYEIKNEISEEISDRKFIRNFIAHYGFDDNIKIKIAKKSVDMKSKHNVYDDDNNLVDSIFLPFARYESEGTKKLFNILGPIFEALDKGSLLIIDEIDSKLHPAIVRLILNMFNSIHINKNNAQLICTTHDVLLLNENIRRDQIWFAEKDMYGESELYSLMDFKGVRKDDPILKNYLLGIYGAIPFKKGSEIFYFKK